MIVRVSLWLRRGIWTMLAIAAAWIVLLFAANYGSCRWSGGEKLNCAVFALIASPLEGVMAGVTAVAKFFGLFLP